MGIKKIHTIFMRYILSFAGIALLIVVVNLGLYFLCINLGVIIPTIEIEKQLTAATEALEKSDELNINDIPQFCDYALFALDGTFTHGTLDEETAISLWENIVENTDSQTNPHEIRIVNREDELLILSYRMTAQFSNTTLRNIIPAADLLLIGIIIGEVILLLVLISRWFGKTLSKKIDILLEVTKKIEDNDLDFKIQSSSIFEIDRALNALDSMKQALKKSLSEQWQADKIRQDQISALAHDLKTPLTIIRGNTELLYETVISEEQKECADFIANSSIQMQNYIQMLIDVTKSDKNLKVNLHTVEIDTLLKEIKSQVAPLCSLAGVLLKWKENYNVKQILIDYEQIKRAIVNIISNSVEYTPKGGEVFFGIYDDEEYLYMEVCDTGCGFSSEALKRATEQFYMGDNSRSSNTHYGIGLYMVNIIATQHNAQLILENSKETGGAKVVIKFSL